MYKDKYQREFFGEVIVNATEELLTTMWAPTKSERLAGCHLWLDTVCSFLEVPKPDFVFIEGNDGSILYRETGGGQVFVDPTTNQIKMFMYKKFSMTTFLHEFRHVMQNMGLVNINQVDSETGMPTRLDPEEDAREWSCSLYFVADPDRYMRAVTSGKLRYC